MNQIATRDDNTRLASIEEKIDRSVSNAMSVGAGGITFQNAGEVMEFAKMMAVSGSAVPKHLRGQPGACLGIIDDAIRFRTSPYALARKSYFVNDNLAYEAQVIAGIINAFAPLKDRPNITYTGEGGNRQCIVTATFKTGTEREYTSPPMSQIHPKNSPLWKSDPDQQLAYYSLRAFARRWCPEVILGIYDVEEMKWAEMRDVSPQLSLQERLAAAREEVEDAREGFDRSFVHSEINGHSEPSDAEIEDIDSASALIPGDDADGSAGSAPAGAPDESAPEVPASKSDAVQEPEASVPPPADASGSSLDERVWLASFARGMVGAIGPDETVAVNQSKGFFRDDLSEDVRKKARSITNYARAACRGDMDRGNAIEMIAGIAGVEPKEIASHG